MEGYIDIHSHILPGIDDGANNFEMSMEMLQTAYDNKIRKIILTPHNKIGRRNEYTAIVSEEDYQAAQTRTFLNKLYEGSAKGLVATLIQKEMLSAEDYEELRRFWESGGEAE